MPLVFAAIAPHGGDTIAEIADDPAVMAKTRDAMEELGRRCTAARPETLVVLNPHGLVIEGAVSLGAAAEAVGALGDHPARRVSLQIETDMALAEAILREAQGASLPVVPVAVRADDKDAGADAYVPLDWGALVPLWFLTRALAPDGEPRAVILAPDRTLPRETLVRIGLAIARAAAKSGKRVALIASCDQGHAHDADGPYGYSPLAAEHDRAMCEAIVADDLASLLDWPNEFMEEAKVDAYWQTIMLAGALGHTPMRGELLSYEAPTYFGMVVAAYSPERK
jgi:aromatic ring-opening dioxygenase LigB subunit